MATASNKIWKNICQNQMHVIQTLYLYVNIIFKILPGVYDKLLTTFYTAYLS